MQIRRRARLTVSDRELLRLAVRSGTVRARRLSGTSHPRRCDRRGGLRGARDWAAGVTSGQLVVLVMRPTPVCLEAAGR